VDLIDAGLRGVFPIGGGLRRVRSATGEKKDGYE
jgi:hypothetical protein